MITYGQKNLNANDVTQETLKFVLLLTILSSFTFFCVFLLFKSTDIQNNNIRYDIETYQNVINKNAIINEKIDSIYNNMVLISNNKVKNEIFLRNKIMTDINECQIVIGQDSIKDFKHYSKFLKNIGAMISTKSDLNKVSNQEQIKQNLLIDCLEDTNKISTNISKITSRKR